MGGKPEEQMNSSSRFRPKLAARETSRRDFLNGTLIAAGGLAVGQSSPMTALAGNFQAIGNAACGDLVGEDPRLGRGGNSPSVFNIAHWLRDQRLQFAPGSVTLAPGCDGIEGTFPIAEDGEHFDVIIAGGGLAGLSSAFYILRRAPRLRILLLEANHFLGGNASCDDQPPLPVKASTCGAYTAIPDADYLIELFQQTHVHEDKYQVQSPVDAYYFDEYSPGRKQGYRGWQIEMLASLGRTGNIENPPYDARVMEDLARCVRTFIDWNRQPGSPDEPPDLSSPKYDYLSEMSFASYLTNVLHCDPRVVDFYTLYTVDCMGGTPHYVNAHTVISFLSSDYTGKFFAYPGGTSRIATQLIDWLTQSDNNGQARHSFSVQTGAMALRVDADPRSAQQASVIYFQDGKFRRATAKALVVATQVQSARHLIAHLIDGERKAAWDEFNSVPALIANVAVRDMTPFLELGLGYSQYWWGGKYFSNFLVADWTTENRLNPKRASVLTFYGHVHVPPEEFAAERMKMLTTPFSDYEKSLKEDLSRVLRGTRFDFDRDVSAIFTYRWGHSMILASTKSVFGNVHGRNGQLDRKKAPRRIACRPLGPISFAGQYAEGTPSVESALGSGYRAALEVLARL
jgi:spermidine dehydrogenase